MPSYSLPELKQIMRDNKLRGLARMNKSEILKLLHDKGLIEDAALVKQEKPVKTVSSSYEFAKSIRLNPKKVFIKDLSTGIETEYPSLYKAAKAINHDARTITRCDGKTLKGKYVITIY